MLQTLRRSLALCVALCLAACGRDSTSPPPAAGADFTVTLLPSGISQHYTDDASFLTYRSAGSEGYDMELVVGPGHLEFEECRVPTAGVLGGDYPVNGTGYSCDGENAWRVILLSFHTIDIPGIVDQATSTLTFDSTSTTRASGRFVINFLTATGQPIARLEGTFSAKPHPCQAKVQADGLLNEACTLFVPSAEMRD